VKGRERREESREERNKFNKPSKAQALRAWDQNCNCA